MPPTSCWTIRQSVTAGGMIFGWSCRRSLVAEGAIVSLWFHWTSTSSRSDL